METNTDSDSYRTVLQPQINGDVTEEQPPNSIISLTSQGSKSALRHISKEKDAVSGDSAVMRTEGSSQNIEGVNYLDENTMNRNDGSQLSSSKEEADKTGEFCVTSCDDNCNFVSVHDKNQNDIANPIKQIQPSAGSSNETNNDRRHDDSENKSSKSNKPNNCAKPIVKESDRKSIQHVVFEIKHTSMTLFELDSENYFEKKLDEKMHWLFAFSFEIFLNFTLFAIGDIPQQRVMYLWDTKEKLLRVLDDDLMRRIYLETEYFRLATLSLCTRLLLCEIRSTRLAGQGFFCDRDDQVKCFSCGVIFDTENTEPVSHHDNCRAIEDTSETIVDNYGAAASTNLMLGNVPIQQERETSLLLRDNLEHQRLRLGNTTSMHQAMQESQLSNASSTLVSSRGLRYVGETDISLTDTFPVPSIVQQPLMVNQSINVPTDDSMVTRGTVSATERSRECTHLSSRRRNSIGHLANTAIEIGTNVIHNPTSATHTVSLAPNGRECPSNYSLSVISTSQNGSVKRDSEETSGAICASNRSTARNKVSWKRSLSTNRSSSEKNNDHYPQANSRCNVTNSLQPPFTHRTNAHSESPFVNAERNTKSSCGHGTNAARTSKAVQTNYVERRIVSNREAISASSESTKSDYMNVELEGTRISKLGNTSSANKRPNAENSIQCQTTVTQMAARKPKFRMTCTDKASHSSRDSCSNSLCEANEKGSKIEKSCTRRKFPKNDASSTAGGFVHPNDGNISIPTNPCRGDFRQTSGTDTDMAVFGHSKKNKKDDRSICRTEYSTFDERMLSFLRCETKNFEQTPQEMALAGQFYTGKDDVTKCYRCGGSLSKWKKDDDPFEEHANWFPDCPLSGKK